MGRAPSRDLRDRVVAAVETRVSCRRAAERFGVSAASAIRWGQLMLAHGTPAAKPQGGDRRTPKIEDHAAFILAAIEQQPDPTLAELCEMLSERGVTTSIVTLSTASSTSTRHTNAPTTSLPVATMQTDRTALAGSSASCRESWRRAVRAGQ